MARVAPGQRVQHVEQPLARLPAAHSDAQVAREAHGGAVAHEDARPQQLTLGQVQRILASLLKEGVPIRNLQTILEALADGCAETKDLQKLTEHVRNRIARTIVEPHLDQGGVLHAAFLDPDLERSLAEALAGNEGLANLPQGFLGRFVDRTAEALAAMARAGRDPVLVTRATLRPFLAEAIAGVIPNAAVLSYQETGPAKKVESVQRIAVSTAAAG